MRRLVVWARSVGERMRQSLFVVPAVFVVGSLVLAELLLELDETVDADALPGFMRTTVENGRALVAAIAGGTITAAALVVSLTLVAVQVAASQFSPRTLRSFIGDRFQQVMIGIIVGTFAYALWVLRAIRAPLTADGSAVVPNVAVLVAVVLGVVSVLAVLASVDHTARSLRVESVARNIEEETRLVVEHRFGADRKPATDAPRSAPAPRPLEDAGGGQEVVAPDAGWVQQIDDRALAEAVPEGATVFIETAVGNYVVEDQVVARVASDRELDDEALRKAARGLAIGDERTMQQDAAYGITRLVDIALKALSPGVNDPQTAEEVVARLGSLVLLLLSCDVDRERVSIADRELVRRHEPDHDAYVDLAFSSIRRHAADEPRVLMVLQRTLRTVEGEIERRGLDVPTDRLRLHQELVQRAADRLELDEDERRLFTELDPLSG